MFITHITRIAKSRYSETTRWCLMADRRLVMNYAIALMVWWIIEHFDCFVLYYRK
jgi:hypothetical protein